MVPVNAIMCGSENQLTGKRNENFVDSKTMDLLYTIDPKLNWSLWISFTVILILTHSPCSSLPKVCELHFTEDDVCRISECYDSKTGRKLTAKLLKPSLKENTVPSIFPACPKYLSSKRTHQEEPETKKAERENLQLEAAIADSLKLQAEFQQKHLYSSLEELLEHVKNVHLPNDMTIIKNKNNVMFLKIDMEPAPVVIYSVVVGNDLQVEAYFRNVKLKKIKDLQLPRKVNNISMLCDLIITVMSNETIDKPE